MVGIARKKQEYFPQNSTKTVQFVNSLISNFPRIFMESLDTGGKNAEAKLFSDLDNRLQKVFQFFS